MKIFNNKHILKKQILKEKSISFIPTMGGLHKGHLSLIKKAKKFKGKILVTIFVNPKQFNNKKDFLKYPRNLRKDLILLKKLRVNFVFIPKLSDIFSFTPKHKVYLDQFSNKLCGRFRSGHFKGVLNVVNRFVEIIRPKRLFLGLKDFQQLVLIKKHLIKRKIKIKIIPCKTIRDKSGVACSSRNKNLNKNELKIASKVYKYLLSKKKLIKKDFSYFKKNEFYKDLLNLGVSKIDYIELYNLISLKKPKNKNSFNIFIAYYLGEVRLIDNI